MQEQEKNKDMQLAWPCIFNYLVPFSPWLKEFISRVEEKFANAFAYEIYTAAPFKQSLQPNKNLHFSPSTPTQATYREKMDNVIKMEKKSGITKSQSNPYSLLLCQSLLPLMFF